MRTPDAVFGLAWSGAITAQRLRALVGQNVGGLVEIYVHPATSDDFEGHAPGYRGAEELAALRDPACMEALRASGASLGGYADA